MPKHSPSYMKNLNDTILSLSRPKEKCPYQFNAIKLANLPKCFLYYLFRNSFNDIVLIPSPIALD